MGISSRWVSRSGPVLALLWAFFWIWFGIASGIAEKLEPAGVVMHTLPGLVFLAVAVLSWRWPAIGGVALIGVGVVVAVVYPLMFSSRFPLKTVVAVLLTMALPPLAAGVLLLLRRPGRAAV